MHDILELDLRLGAFERAGVPHDLLVRLTVAISLDRGLGLANSALDYSPDRRSRPPIPCADHATRSDSPSGRVSFGLIASATLPVPKLPEPTV